MVRWVKVGLALLGAAAVIVLLVPPFATARGPGPDSECVSNMCALLTALRMYALDYGEAPDPRLWCDQLREYAGDESAFQCPRAQGLRSGYALNPGAAGAARAIGDSPESAHLVVIFESDRGWNAHGGRELLPVKPRYEGGDNYGFPDGHVQWAKRGDESVPVQWQPGGSAGRPRGLTAGH